MLTRLRFVLGSAAAVAVAAASSLLPSTGATIVRAAAHRAFRRRAVLQLTAWCDGTESGSVFALVRGSEQPWFAGWIAPGGIYLWRAPLGGEIILSPDDTLSVDARQVSRVFLAYADVVDDGPLIYCSEERSYEPDGAEIVSRLDWYADNSLEARLTRHRETQLLDDYCKWEEWG